MADLSQIVARMVAIENTARRQKLLIGSSAYWLIVSRVSAAAYRERYAYLSLERDELASEVAMAAARRMALRTYEDVDTLRKDAEYFVRRETRNLCERIARKRGAESNGRRDLSLEELESNTPGEPVGFTLLVAFESLTSDERMLIHMRDMEGMTIRDMARQMGTPVTTVWRNYGKARKKMERYLTEDHDA